VGATWWAVLRDKVEVDFAMGRRLRRSEKDAKQFNKDMGSRIINTALFATASMELHRQQQKVCKRS
jgi:hypothetical protein